MTVIASCYKDESSRAILEREFGRTELLVDYLDVAETESTNAAPDSLGEFWFYLVCPVRMYLVDGIIGDQPRYIWR